MSTPETCGRDHDPSRRYVVRQKRSGKVYKYNRCHDCDLLYKANDVPPPKPRAKPLPKCVCGHIRHVHVERECFHATDGEYDCECVSFTERSV